MLFDFIYDVNQYIHDVLNVGKRITIVLHSSVILESAVNLQKLNDIKNFNKKVKIIIPENCLYELKLLSRYANAGKSSKADYLIKHFSSKYEWSMNKMIQYRRKMKYHYSSERMLFVFFEPAIAEYFSKNMGHIDGVHLLSYNPLDKNSMINFPMDIGSNIYRHCTPLYISVKNEFFLQGHTLEICDSKKQLIKKIPSSQLQFKHCGGEATLYVCEQMPQKLLKIYHLYPSERMVKKLKALCVMREVLINCVLPESFIYVGGRCVGYVMAEIDGVNLDKAIANYTANQRYQLIAKLSAVLLELRMQQLVVTDISDGNICIGRDGAVHIIDCDSMEFMHFPGGGSTCPYAHPDVDNSYYYSKLRTTDQFHFSYAVVLFEILMGWNNPLIQCGKGDEEFEWKKHLFPYGNDAKQNGISVKDVTPRADMLKEWQSHTYAQRKAFVEVFTFQKSLDIGDWMKAMCVELKLY